MSLNVLKEKCKEYVNIEKRYYDYINNKAGEIEFEEDDCSEFYYLEEAGDASINFQEILEDDVQFQKLENELESISNEIVELLFLNKNKILADPSLIDFEQIVQNIYSGIFTQKIVFKNGGLALEPKKKLIKQRKEQLINIFLLNYQTTLPDQVERFAEILPFLSSAKPHFHTQNLYNQIIQCYVNGNFEACCVLSRALVEAVANRIIKHSGYGDYLVGSESSKKKKTLPKILKEYLNFSTDCLQCFRKINNVADKILHLEAKADSSVALKTIEDVQLFIKLLPKTLA